MKKLMYLTLLGGITLSLNSCNTRGYVRTEPEYIEINRPPRPYNNYIWIEGDWIWSNPNNTYVKRESYWSEPVRGRNYQKGHWKKTNRGSKWIKGKWR